MAFLTGLVALSVTAHGQVTGVSSTLEFENAYEIGGDDALIGPAFVLRHGINITAGAGERTLTSPQGGLKSKPWFWRFQTSGDHKIAPIEIQTVGTGNLRGFAFDCSEAPPGPVPAELPLGLFGLGLVALRRRRARRQKNANRAGQSGFHRPAAPTGKSL